jgi:hypothetical protein
MAQTGRDQRLPGLGAVTSPFPGMRICEDLQRDKQGCARSTARKCAVAAGFTNGEGATPGGEGSHYRGGWFTLRLI